MDINILTYTFTAKHYASSCSIWNLLLNVTLLFPQSFKKHHFKTSLVWTVFSWSRWLEIRGLRYYPSFFTNLECGLGQVMRAKSTIKEALHVHDILWFSSTLSHTISYLILPPASWEEYSSIIKFSIIKNRDLRLRETKSLVHSHINSKCQSADSFRCRASLCHPSAPLCHSLVSSNIISLDEQRCLMWWSETTQGDGEHELWFMLIKTYSQ